MWQIPKQKQCKEKKRFIWFKIPAKSFNSGKSSQTLIHYIHSQEKKQDKGMDPYLLAGFCSAKYYSGSSCLGNGATNERMDLFTSINNEDNPTYSCT